MIHRIVIDGFDLVFEYAFLIQKNTESARWQNRIKNDDNNKSSTH